MKKGSTVLILLILAFGALSTAYAAGSAYTSFNYPGASGTGATGINAAGTIVGAHWKGPFSSSEFQGFSLSGAAFTPIDYPGASSTEANGINDAGTIVGRYADASGAASGFSLSNGDYTTMAAPAPDASNAEANGINNAGTIVGDYYDASGMDQGFTLSGTTFTPINYPGASGTCPNGIANAGTIVGNYYDASGMSHGFSLSNGTFTPINYPGASSTVATGINDAGTIVGFYTDARGVMHGFALSNGSYTPLNYPGALATGAGSINSSGEIVGLYADASGVFHGFLTKPSTALSSGWNLVSLPAQPTDAAIASVLSGIEGALDVVWAYPNQTWQVYDPIDTAGSTLTTMQAGMGYWIKMTSPKTLFVPGTAPSPSVQLSAGWNLVGYNGTSCVAPSTALSSLTIPSSLQVSWAYPGHVWQFYDPNETLDSTLTQLCPGNGYWIDVNQAGTWTMPSN